MADSDTLGVAGGLSGTAKGSGKWRGRGRQRASAVSTRFNKILGVPVQFFVASYIVPYLQQTPQKGDCELGFAVSCQLQLAQLVDESLKAIGGFCHMSLTLPNQPGALHL